MNEHERNILASRRNWQSVKQNDVAGKAYYDKCECILKDYGGALLDPGMTIIDLGCADGRFTELLTAFCKMGIGYEFSQTMLEKARKTRSGEKTAFYPIDLEKRD